MSPGFLRSEAVLDHFGVREDNWRDAIEKDPFFAESESPQLVGRAVVALAAVVGLHSDAGLVDPALIRMAWGGRPAWRFRQGR